MNMRSVVDTSKNIYCNTGFELIPNPLENTYKEEMKRQRESIAENSKMEMDSDKNEISYKK
jgi:hypothetical protein